MNLIVKGRHVEVTPALRERIEKKLNKLERKFDHIHKIDVELNYEKGKNRERSECEITLFADHIIFRSHAEHEDMYAAIDNAVKKIEKQISRYKGKAYSSENRYSRRRSAARAEKEEGPTIVKRKYFEIASMDEEKAVMQMEMLDHDFFIFINEETGRVSLLYRRKDKNLGLIETDITVE